MPAYRYLIPAFCLLAACSNPASRSNAQPAALSESQSAPLAGAPLAEPGRLAPSDAATMRLSFAPVVRKAAPAVVNVFSRQVVRQTVDPFWGMFGGGLGVPRERVAQSLGSGVIVRSDGVIVTNNHVIAGGQEIRVVLGDRREFPAKVLLADARADIAVLKIDVGHEVLPTLALDDRDDAQVGDLVLAIGDPFGVGQTVTNGIVSAIARTGVGITDVSYFIQTDAAINPGNSGGALVDMNGNMIGMNTAILSQSGASSGVGFAIPATLVKRVVQQALGGHGAAAGRPWLGVKTQDVTADIAASMGLPRPEGVLVTDLYPGGPGERAGLHQGDLITAIDGAPVNDAATLNYHVATRQAGDEVSLTVRRGKEAQRTVRLRIEAPPGGGTVSELHISGHNPLDGATVIDLTPAAAEQLGVDPFAANGGVLVTKVGEGVAANIGLQ
ncbi:MAG: trypsin-like peptidase domain-containing protein, partial [Caulobacteraceae bacterium]|nr:trypsin-like peptidase domain-containing protein [Caulobacteraceae bacterium]